MFFDSPTPVIQNRDLFGYVLIKYTDKCKELKQSASLEGYLSFAREYLVSYPPVNIKYLASGLGVQLSSGEILAFTPNQLGMTVMQDEGMSIIAAKGFDQSSGQTIPSPDLSIIAPTKTEVAAEKPPTQETPKVEEMKDESIPIVSTPPPEESTKTKPPKRKSN